MTYSTKRDDLKVLIVLFLVGWAQGFICAVLVFK
jgi:hypothetical protein